MTWVRDWNPATVRALSGRQENERAAGRVTSTALAYDIDHALECFATLLEGGEVRLLRKQVATLAEQLAQARGTPVAVSNPGGGYTTYGGRFVGKAAPQ